MGLPNLTQLPNPLVARIGWPWTSKFLPEPGNVIPAGFPWPRISIVTPSFNQGLFIEETIRSVLLQGYPNLEYILMDGGSTDSTRDILETYKPHFAHVHIGPDGGQAAALSAGFERSTGEIMAWLNSDDIYLPGALVRVARFFSRHPECELVSGDVQLIDRHSNPTGMLKAVRTQLFLTKNTGGHGWWQPGTFWKRQAYLDAGGVDTTLAFCMDRDLFTRICSKAKSDSLVGPPVAAFRIQDDQKSQRILDIFRQEHELLLTRYGDPRLRPFLHVMGRFWQLWTVIDRLRHDLRSWWAGY